MSSCYQCQAIVVVERLGDVLPEGVTSTTRRDPPTTSVIWVGPEKIAHGSFMGNLLYPVQCTNVVQRIDAGGETAVEAEDLVFDEGGEGEEIEKISEVFPDIGIAIFAQAFIVETVDLSDLTGFVVAA